MQFMVGAGLKPVPTEDMALKAGQCRNSLTGLFYTAHPGPVGGLSPHAFAQPYLLSLEKYRIGKNIGLKNGFDKSGKHVILHPRMNTTQPHKKHTILLVDDNRDLLLVQGAILAEEGYNVITGATGAEAMELLEGSHVDLVILDLKLPDIDGEALMGKMKRIRPGAKFIIMTGCDDISKYIETLQNGAIDYLIKPFSPKGLVKVLKKVLV